MGININLNPAIDLLVLNLNSMNEGGRAICACEVLQRGGPVVVLSVEGGFKLGDNRAGSDGGLGRSDRF